MGRESFFQAWDGTMDVLYYLDTVSFGVLWGKCFLGCNTTVISQNTNV